jgi:hypothetical protein
MALGWGDNAWGDDTWGGTIPVTGNQAISNVGTASPVVSVAVTGVGASGAVGTVVQNQSITEIGDLAVASVGTVGASVTVALTGVSASGLNGTAWGEGAWGSGFWGGTNVGFGYGFDVTGVSATGTVGNVLVAERLIALTGVGASGEVGSVVNAFSNTLTGVAAAGNVGTVVATNTLGITGNSALGEVTGPIVPLNSNQAQAYVGTVTYEITVELTGVGSTGTVGTMSTPRTFGLTGNGATGNVGDVTAVYWKLISDKQSTVWQNINTS